MLNGLSVIPDTTATDLHFNMDLGKVRYHHGSNGKNRGPREESSDGDEGPGGGAAVCIEGRDGAAQVDGEGDRIPSQAGTDSRPILEGQEKD